MATESSCGFLFSSKFRRQGVEDGASKVGNMISSFQESLSKSSSFSTCDKGFRQDVSQKAAQHAHDTKSQDVFQKMESAVPFSVFSLFPLFSSSLSSQKLSWQSHFQAAPSIQSRLVSLSCMWQNPCTSRIAAYNQSF